ncbi:MAG: Clp protease N-terminal domain-containing protein, partial [Bacteroidota bacterium]
MDFNNYTIKAQEAVQKAVETARSKRQQSVEGGHLLKGMLTVEDSIIPFMLKKLGVNVDFLEQKLNELIEGSSKVSGASGGQFFSNDMHQILERANKEAGKLKDEFITLEHLLLGLIHSKNGVGQLLKEQGVND